MDGDGEIAEPGGRSPRPATATDEAPSPIVTVRLATPDDRDLVLGWANDPVTRAWSFHPTPIEPETHAAWFAARLIDQANRLWIGETQGVPVGQVRAHIGDDGRVELGISVAPEARGRRLAAPLLQAGMAAADRELGATAFVAAPNCRQHGVGGGLAETAEAAAA